MSKRTAQHNSSDSSDSAHLDILSNTDIAPLSFTQKLLAKWENFTIFQGLIEDSWNVHSIATHDESFITDQVYTVDNRSTWRCLQGKWNGFFDKMNPPVFMTAAFALILFLAVFSIFPQFCQKVFLPAKSWLAMHFGWFYILCSVALLFLLIYLMMGRYGDIRFGDDDSEPRFSYSTWVSMLFAAGMGIGLVFYGMAEPLADYANPPNDFYTDQQRLERAVPLALFNWGINVWSFYSFLGLCIGYYSSRLKLPFSIRSVFYPFLGKYTLRWPGHIIDVISIFGTLFGLATSLGLGAQQMNAGIHFVFNRIPISFGAQAVIIVITTTGACISLCTGLGRGMKWMSIINMLLVTLLLLCVFFIRDRNVDNSSSTQQMVDGFVQNMGTYVTILLERTTRVAAYSIEEKDWMKDWTLYYMAWFISWCPFVAVFLATISEGRTIREYVATTLFVPVIICLFWFTVFGNAAINAYKMDSDLINVPQEELIFRVYTLYAEEGFISTPTKVFLQVLTIIVLMVFFISSSDSGSFVVDCLGSGGSPTSPLWQKLYWAVMEGLTALILVYAGGSDALSALQACVLMLGLPIGILLMLAAVGLIYTLRLDPYIVSQPAPVGMAPSLYTGHVDIDAVKRANRMGIKLGHQPILMEGKEANSEPLLVV